MTDTMSEQQPPATAALTTPALPLSGKQIIIAKAELQCILDALATAGYTIIGPTVRQEAIVYEEIGRLEPATSHAALSRRHPQTAP